MIECSISMDRHGSGVSSLSALFKPLLPAEPRILNPAAEHVLTERFLLPALAELEVFFLAVRAWVDPVLQQRCPLKHGKPYPLGQCLEISLTVQQLLPQIDPATLTKTAAQGHAAFSSFLRAGGTMRRMWGALRETYFQNAFQLGTLYLDVSNDTVVPSKPKVEILPFSKAQFVPIKDYHHFRQIAARYWQDTIVPNHVLPELAPYYPLIHIAPSNKVSLHSSTGYMVNMTLAARFKPSEDILKEASMPVDIFSIVANALRGCSLKLASNPEQGRLRALQYCRQYRAKRRYQSLSAWDRVLTGVFEVNQHLAALADAQESTSLPKIVSAPAATDGVPILPIAPPGHSMPNVNIITKARHGGKRWKRCTDYRFAARDALIPLAAQELPQAMMSLPIAFAQENGQYILVAVLGLQNGSNLFVGPNGEWTGAYLPAHYQHHSFTLADVANGQRVLCIDENSSLLSDNEGTPFFSEDGHPTQGISDMMNFLAQVDSNRILTRKACAALHRMGLMQPWPFRLQSDAGEKTINGLYRIDESALAGLSAECLKALQENGALTVAYCQLLSMQQMGKLVKLAQGRP